MSLNVFYHTILDCSMPFGNIIDEKSRVYVIPYAITIMTKQHQHYDCEEDIMILDIINIISQPYYIHTCSDILSHKAWHKWYDHVPM